MALPDGTFADGQAPVIISASRATDIPAFYADWFVARWKAGYVRWRNPFNGADTYVSFSKARAVVFWSKNPRPLMPHLAFLDEHVPNFYFQFTLNDYERDGFEPHLPSLEARIDTFCELSERVGRQRVIWRFDPLILSPTAGMDELLRRIETIGDRLHRHTDRLIFSFADIAGYRNASRNMAASAHREFAEGDISRFANGLQALNQNWGLRMATCAEAAALEQYGIEHSRCIDDRLMADIFRHDEPLMDFLGLPRQNNSLWSADREATFSHSNKDRGQRPLCLCARSKDIGVYSSCPHGCTYCYANVSADAARRNYERFCRQPDRDSIV